MAGVDLERDECIRPDTTLERLAGLRPGVPHRRHGHRRQRLAPERRRRRRRCSASADGVERGAGAPLARIVSRATAGVDPPLFGIGPVRPRAPRCGGPGSTGATWTPVELNEAFAAQSLACLAEWPELDPAIVNPNGGAIAIGHPLGCSGARILGTLAHHLARTGGGYGLAAMCIGVGQGIAVVVENLRR